MHSRAEYDCAQMTQKQAMMRFNTAVISEMCDNAYERDIHDGVSDKPSFYSSFQDSTGKWLIKLHRYWSAAVKIFTDPTISCYCKEISSYKDMMPPIGGAYLIGLEYLMDDFARSTGEEYLSKSSIDILREVYTWQMDSKIKDLDSVPFLLRTEYWPKMDITITFEMLDFVSGFSNTGSARDHNVEDGAGEGAGCEIPLTSSHSFTESEQIGHDNMKKLYDAAVYVEENARKSRRKIPRPNLHVETDVDSDTDVEARVSPEIGHPLLSGDPIEDEEMAARSCSFPRTTPRTLTAQEQENARQRHLITTDLCDNN